MELLSAVVVAAWIAGSFGVIAILLPAAALQSSANPDQRLYGPALVGTWLMLAVLVPLTASVRGFNWVTALVISAASPALAWGWSHRGEHRRALRRSVRSLIFSILEAGNFRRGVARTSATALSACVVSGAFLFSTGGMDVRLPSPVDFDTLARTRQLLSGTLAWDPLASLLAVVTRVAAADALTTMRAMRLAFIAVTAAAAAGLFAAITRSRFESAGSVLASVALVPLAPRAPLVTWAIALSVMVGVTALVHCFRYQSTRHGWYALGALVLAACLVMPFADRAEAFWQVSATHEYLEHPSAAREAVRLARSSVDDWLLVAPPEQQLEIDGRGRFYDLARFVARFDGRVANPDFRFDLGVGRVFVFVEKKPFDVSRPGAGSRFVASQPPVYRVFSERTELQQRAMRICDEYRRTHSGVEVVFDDAVLRVYRIDV
jgi:hypothetical protein